MRLSALFAVAALAASTASASAATLAPMHNATVDLGSTRGSAYYVVAPDGYHLVATLQSGGASTPIRFNTVLADGQSASVSIPGPVGTNPTEVTFTRSESRLVVHQTTDVDEDVATQ